MRRWYAFQVNDDGSHCVGEVWAPDACQAYTLALNELRCRVDFVSAHETVALRAAA